VRVRFDPIVHQADGWSNLEHFPEIARRCQELGIKHVHFSFAQFNEAFYPQVVENLRAAGINLIHPDKPRRMADLRQMVAIAEPSHISLHSCVSNTFGLVPTGACIDGHFFGQLFGVSVDTTKDPSQRRKCQCAVSLDLGSYDYPCAHYCAYCYARGRSGARSRRVEAKL
jgi:DNA repair photolyase